MLKNISFCFILSFCWIHTAYTQTIDSIYYGWVVYEHQEDSQDIGSKKCYIIAMPHHTNTSYTADRNPYFSITRYAKDRTEEINVYSGYEYKISSDVHLMIGNQQKQLFTKNDMAWAKSDYDDKDIINLMLNNEYLMVRSDSATGNFAIDEYKMKGLTRAYARIKELCQ